MSTHHAYQNSVEKPRLASQFHFQFKLNADKSKLLATCRPVEFTDNNINAAQVYETIKALDMGNLYILDSAVAELVQEYLRGNKNKTIVVAERRDGQAIIYVDEHKLVAQLEIIPAFGGSPVGLPELKQALVSARVTSGLKKKVLNQCLKTGVADRVVIAEGAKVIQGKNTLFDTFVAEARDRRPKINADGSVDYRDFGQIVVVEKGTELVRRYPATLGKPGKDLMGNIIEPIPGVDLDFVSELNGVELSKTDGNLLIASKKGQPIITEAGVHIEDIMQVENVDLANGDIVFDGCVHVQGDVAANMNIEATGDVLIEGMVEAANISAGGDIIVRGSVIGRGEVFDQHGKINPQAVLLKAKGSVSLNIVENVRVKSGDAIFVKELVSRCELTAFNEIIVGGVSSKAGKIVGGKIRSGILISANSIGSIAGTKTELEISDDGSAKSILNEVIVKLSKALEKLKKFEPIILAARTKQSGSSKLYDKLLSQRGAAYREYLVLDAHKSLLRKEIKRCKDGTIDVKIELFAGTTIRIGNRLKKMIEDIKGRVFKINNDNIY